MYLPFSKASYILENAADCDKQYVKEVEKSIVHGCQGVVCVDGDQAAPRVPLHPTFIRPPTTVTGEDSRAEKRGRAWIQNETTYDANGRTFWDGG